MHVLQLCSSLTLAALGVLAAASVHAQDLLDVGKAPQQGLKLDVLASAELRAGNVKLTSLSEQLWARYTRGQHYASLLGTHAFGVEDGKRFLNAARALAQYRYSAWPNLLGGLGPEVILHYDRDEFRRREYLFNAGLGPYIQILHTARVHWNVTAAYVYEFEQFAKLTSETDPGKVTRDSEFKLTAHRAWFGSEFGWEIAERIHLGESLIVQVPLDHCTCDTRVYTTTYLRFYGNDSLGLQTALSLIYDSGSALTVDRFDIIVRSSLVFSL